MKLLSQFALFAALALPASLAAATISGTVTDRTTNKPAAGDTAILLDLQQAMTESARTTIDAKGHYSFTVPDNAGMHLVQVEHQKASYYGPVPPNTTVVNIDVFDVAPEVDGLHLYADVSRFETNQQGLSVTESYFIRNESKPPKTQLSAHSFEFYLPQGAVLEGSTATGSGRHGGFQFAGPDGRPRATTPLSSRCVPVRRASRSATTFRTVAAQICTLGRAARETSRSCCQRA